MPASVLLLDVMDTLVHDPFFEEVLDFLGHDLEEFLAVKNKDAWIEFEHGHIDEASYFARFYRDGRPVDGAGLKDCHRTAYRWLDGMEELLSELHRRGVSMHALSNYPSWWRMIEEKLALSRFLEWSSVSCMTGVRKPAAEAYLGAARRAGVAPEQCLFVDDRDGNCAAARAVGMDAVVFADAAGLRAALEKRGVL